MSLEDTPKKRAAFHRYGAHPRCHQGALRIIAAISSGPVIRRILFDLKLAADPPPLALARLEPDRFAWASA